MLRRTYSVAALAAALLAGCVYAPEAAQPVRPEMAGMPAGHMQMSPEMHAQHMAMMSGHHAKAAPAAPRNLSTTAASPDIAAAVRIIYGGSVKGSNCAELITLEDVDGGRMVWF